MLPIFTVVVASYLVGSFPTSLVVGRILRGVDVREQGSGNLGATNVQRTLGWLPGVFVLAVDLAKGFVAVELARRFQVAESPVVAEWLPLIAGVAVILGHLYPIFAGFRGGKGVATSAGVVLALDPLLLAIALGVFLVVVVSWRRISLGSIAAAASLPVALLLLQALAARPVASSWLGFNLLIALLIAHTHRQNLARLVAGTETRL